MSGYRERCPVHGVARGEGGSGKGEGGSGKGGTDDEKDR